MLMIRRSWLVAWVLASTACRDVASTTVAHRFALVSVSGELPGVLSRDPFTTILVTGGELSLDGTSNFESQLSLRLERGGSVTDSSVTTRGRYRMDGQRLHLDAADGHVSILDMRGDTLESISSQGRLYRYVATTAQ
jgi:hypothetical protein